MERGVVLQLLLRPHHLCSVATAGCERVRQAEGSDSWCTRYFPNRLHGSDVPDELDHTIVLYPRSQRSCVSDQRPEPHDSAAGAPVSLADAQHLPL